MRRSGQLCAWLVGLLVAGMGGVGYGAEDDRVEEWPVAAREQLNATLWVQRAAEYGLLAGQVWRAASEKLTTALVAPGTAALEQLAMPVAHWATLPTAIVLDLDETVLDNSAYQARRIRAGADYDEPSWQAWMAEANATAVPGAKEFLLTASAQGHHLVYLTNRRCIGLPVSEGKAADPCPAERWTLENLRKLGLPFIEGRDLLLLRGARAEWDQSDKRSRRAWVAERYRIIALLGDDLHDFADRADFAARAEQLTPWFGERWFLLPNPMYGSWDRALIGDVCSANDSVADCAAKVRDRRYRSLLP